MTKDELRALLADLVPAAIADGRAYVVRRPAGKAVRELPNEQPALRAPRPRRIYQRQGIYGAGFAIPTYKPFQGVSKDDPVQDRAADATAYYCFMCEKFGKDCTC